MDIANFLIVFLQKKHSYEEFLTPNRTRTDTNRGAMVKVVRPYWWILSLYPLYMGYIVRKLRYM
jgi:hypothetical protein